LFPYTGDHPGELLESGPAEDPTTEDNAAEAGTSDDEGDTPASDIGDAPVAA
jgi:hypothetical protein